MNLEINKISALESFSYLNKFIYSNCKTYKATLQKFICVLGNIVRVVYEISSVLRWNKYII